MWFGQLVSAVEALHRIRICHRDIKLENIFMSACSDGNLCVKLGDLGMGTLQPEGFLSASSCGSPHYVAPEVLLGEPYDAVLSDVWSCGVVLYALASYTLPFDDDHIPTVLLKIKNCVFDMHESIQGETRDLVSRILVADPDERFTISDIKAHAFLNTFVWPTEECDTRDECGGVEAHDPYAVAQMALLLRCTKLEAKEALNDPNDMEAHLIYRKLAISQVFHHGLAHNDEFAVEQEANVCPSDSPSVKETQRFPETPRTSSLQYPNAPASAPAVVTSFQEEIRLFSPVTLDPPRSAGFADIQQDFAPTRLGSSPAARLRKRWSIQQRIRSFFVRDGPTSIFEQAEEDSSRRVVMHMPYMGSIKAEEDAKQVKVQPPRGLRRSRCIKALQRALQGLTPVNLSTSSSPTLEETAFFDVSQLSLPPGLSSYSPEKSDRVDENLLSPFGRSHFAHNEPDTTKEQRFCSPFSRYDDSPASPETLRQGSTNARVDFVLSTPSPKVRKRHSRPLPLLLHTADNKFGTPPGKKENNSGVVYRGRSKNKTRPRLLNSPTSPTAAFATSNLGNNGLSATSANLFDQLIKHVAGLERDVLDLEIERDMLGRQIQEQNDKITRLESRVQELETGQSDM
ncbi:serine/threonine-protein kinase gin4 [Microbotryomycetes sp. JL201]|nr:serine/threonine-protein kinase gin4 [Microbotryomycetes sp. JL201]